MAFFCIEIPCRWASDCPLVRLISMPSKLVLFLGSALRHRFNQWVDDLLCQASRKMRLLGLVLNMVMFKYTRKGRENPSDARTKSREIKARFWSSRNLNFKTWKSLSHLGGCNLVAVNLDDSWIWERQIGKSPPYSWVKIKHACNSTTKVK